MSSIEERQEALIEEFSFFDDWMDKYAHIIEQGRSMDLVADSFKTKDNLIKGCQSKVWIDAREDQGKLLLRGDSDSSIAKGIVAMVLRVLSGLKCEEILESELYFIDSIGLKDHLSPSRSNGLLSMIKQVKLYAFVFKNKESN